MENEPNFNEYTEVTENGKVVGFHLEGDPFLYRYDHHGGWYDAKGNYYNSDAQRCEPPDSSDDEPTAKEAPNEQYMLQAKPQASTQRQEAIRQLLELIDSYPEDKHVAISYEDDKHDLSSQAINTLLETRQIKATFKDSSAVVDKKTAVELVDLEGYKHDGSTLYLYIKLFDSDTVVATFKQPPSIRDIRSILEELDLEHNKDFANIEIEQDQAYFELVRKHFERVKQQFEAREAQFRLSQ